MLAAWKSELCSRLESRVRDLYGLDFTASVEVPPRRELGDLALTAGLQLARELKRNPRAIGEEIAAGWELPPWVRAVKVEGPGFLNVSIDRGRAAQRLLTEPLLRAAADLPKVVVEHTNINPNKAAHIGHLRNAVLGDILVRLLRALGHPVEVQNYIDDTGVQLADVVVGFVDLEGMGAAEIAAVGEPFDYRCWDLYSEVGRWYEEDEGRRELRRRTLHELEAGSGPRAEVGRIVARRVVRRHLGTMTRLGVSYDLLTHESSILGLDFFRRAFEELREKGAIRLEREGKNAGCWVMPLSETREFAGMEDPDKVIVRSDGTVTYVGKDIAYQLWKLGLLGLDFGYRRWSEAGVWESVAEDGEEEHPDFGGAWKVINVIDARQSYLQQVVRAGVERLGFVEEAERSVHFAYEMVSLSAAAARQLGVLEEGGGDGRLEMSGRKGIGVKADDLLDQLEEKATEEIARRNPEIAGEELEGLARRISSSALRFFMARATTNRVIAFDFDEALNFEGDSGPYLLYSMVRARNIARRLEEEGLSSEVSPAELASLAPEAWSDDLWDLALTVAQIPERVKAAADSLELSMVARLALELAQKFNAFYHRHPILHEEDEALRTVRLGATAIFERGMATLLELMGLEVPERM
ncbi:MAG: arginine--tRNA ligase [Thermoanaerobaculia bacterium]|nr:arginine--tRNA ligase [Thermoanaerobaculia bacterium]